MWDAIVIGSGIGGMAAGAALAKRRKRVLLLEQHTRAGGLTQTFRRQRWEFAPGVHYIAGVGPQRGPEGQFGRLLDWLTDGAIRFAPSANPYDIVRLPGFEFGISHPEAAYRAALLSRFPAQRSAITHWFEACAEARESAYALFALHGTPAWMGWALRLWRGAQAQPWARRTLADVLSGIDDPVLRAALGARWADYGAAPADAPFVEHALVMHAYDSGSWYPVGGAARFAQALVPVIEAAGGELRLGADVQRILTRDGHVFGVDYSHGDRLRREEAAYIVSAMGAANTVGCLSGDAAAAWQSTIRTFAPGRAAVSLFVGFEGDIAAGGASSANHWIYESDDIGAAWQHPADDDAPAIFISFPSLKDPACTGEPTAEIVAAVGTHAFRPWLALPDTDRSENYRDLKARIEDRLLSQFRRHFPKLAPLVRFHELATPLTQRRFVRTPDGSMYGIEMSVDRLTSPALHVRTPVPRLYLAGQDVIGPGLPAAFMGGLLAAAAIEPSLWPSLSM